MQPPRLDPLPPGLVSLDDHQRHAAQLLDADRLAFFAGAAADGLTDAANRQAWSALQLAPRVLQDMQDSHTRTRLLGRTLDCRCCWPRWRTSGWPIPMAKSAPPLPPRPARPAWC